MKKIELLAPAGNKEALTAAVENGADAVYIGGSMFSARQSANNFSFKELAENTDYAHSRGVKIYVAVNTLIANQEIEDLVSYLYSLIEAQIDAIIVQDIGAAGLIRSILPGIELHASTQMAVHNSQGINYLAERGFTRAVLAREVSFANIQLIRENSSLDLETFVHGALCVAYSGQCLMSSMIGGRSGNRGRCAQPCRLKYKLVDEKGKEVVEAAGIGEHLLSPRDLKMIEHIPELVAAGITSLKVEGRMKRPEYVAVVIKNYRRAIDEYYKNPETFEVREETEKELKQIFNRDFSTGYYFGNQGINLMSYKRPNNRGLLLGRITEIKGNIITIKLNEALTEGDGYEVWVTKGGRVAGQVNEIYVNSRKVNRAEAGQEVEIKVDGKPKVGDRVFKTYDLELMRSATESFLSPKSNRKLKLSLNAEIKEGKTISLKAIDEEGFKVECSGSFKVEKANKHPINYGTIRKQFERLGNTPFKLTELNVDMDEDIMAPVSELNKLRREIVDRLIKKHQEQLKTELISKKEYYEQVNELISRIPPQQPNYDKPLLSVLVGNPSALQAAVDAGADQIYVNWEGLKNTKGFNFKSLQEGIKYCKFRNKKIILRLPRFVPEIGLKVLNDFLQKIKELDLDGILVGNLGILQQATNMGFTNIYADYTLNIFNDLTIQELIKNGIMQATLSPELTLEQIRQFSYLGNIPLETIVHGNFPLMVSEYCVVGNVLGGKTANKTCREACSGKLFGLKDRMNFIFPLFQDEYCRMLVYNSKPLRLYSELKGFFESEIDVLRIEGRKEDAKWIGIVTASYRSAIDMWLNSGDFLPNGEIISKLDRLEPNGYTKGHYFRGVL